MLLEKESQVSAQSFIQPSAQDNKDEQEKIRGALHRGTTDLYTRGDHDAFLKAYRGKGCAPRCARLEFNVINQEKPGNSLSNETSNWSDKQQIRKQISNKETV